MTPLRNAAIHAIVCRRTAPGDDGAADTEGNRRALADLDRRLARWKRRHPDLRMESMVVHGSLLEYLTYNRRSVRMTPTARCSSLIDDICKFRGDYEDKGH